MSGLLRDYQKNTFCMSLLNGREPGLSNAWCVCDLSLVHLVPIVISYLRSSFLFLCLCFGAVRNWRERNRMLMETSSAFVALIIHVVFFPYFLVYYVFGD